MLHCVPLLVLTLALDAGAPAPDTRALKAELRLIAARANRGFAATSAITTPAPIPNHFIRSSLYGAAPSTLRRRA